MLPLFNDLGSKHDMEVGVTSLLFTSKVLHFGGIRQLIRHLLKSQFHLLTPPSRSS